MPKLLNNMTHGSSTQKSKFSKAAKKCKGTGKGFRECMKRELKK